MHVSLACCPLDQVPLQMAPLKMLQQHLKAKHWLFEGELSSQVHLRPHISWNTPFQLLFSTNTTSLFTAYGKYRVELSDFSETPSSSLILWTLPLLSLHTLTIRAIGHWFQSASCLSSTISPTWQFRFCCSISHCFEGSAGPLFSICPKTR